MRKVGIMLEFTDDVYDSLVEPLKKTKAFSKFLASLVNGYLGDGYIRDYVDDSLEGRKRAMADSLNESINSMSESLSNMGLFTDELESISSGGRAKFKSRAEKAAEEINNNSTCVTPSDDVSKINSRIDGMQESINSILELLKTSSQGIPFGMPYIPQYSMGMMGAPNGVGINQSNMFMGIGMTNGQSPQQPVNNQSLQQNQSSVQSSVIESNSTDVKKDSNIDSFDNNAVDDSDGVSSSNAFTEYNNSRDFSDDSDSGDSDNFMSSFMEGNSYEF